MSRSSREYVGLGVKTLRKASEDKSCAGMPFRSKILMRASATTDLPLPGSPVIQTHQPVFNFKPLPEGFAATIFLDLSAQYLLIVALL